MTPQQEVRDRNGALDHDTLPGMRNGKEYQRHGDTAGYKKPEADPGCWTWNRSTGTLDTNRHADLEHQQPEGWRRKGQSQDRRRTARQNSNYMNRGYQNRGRRLRWQDSRGDASVSHDLLDMGGEEQTQEGGRSTRDQACSMTSGYLGKDGVTRPHDSDIAREHDQPPGIWRKGQLQEHDITRMHHSCQMALGHYEQGEIVRPQDAGRGGTGAGSLDQTADRRKREGIWDQDGTTQHTHPCMNSGYPEETRTVRFQEIGTNVGGQEHCSTSAMRDRNNRPQVPMHTRQARSPIPQEDGGQEHARNSDGEVVNRASNGQGVGGEPWQQAKITGSQNSKAPGSETRPQRMNWLDQVMASEGFLRGKRSLVTMV